VVSEQTTDKGTRSTISRKPQDGDGMFSSFTKLRPFGRDKYEATFHSYCEEQSGHLRKVVQFEQKPHILTMVGQTSSFKKKRGQKLELVDI